MKEASKITWINIRDEKPPESGWYMVVLKPKNYMEFIDNPKIMNSWINKFGINKMLWNNREFWEGSSEITDRVTYWGYLPTVPLYK